MLERVALLLSQARGAYQREQFDIALAYFQRARQVDSHSPEALLGIGEVAAYLGRRKEAIEAFLTLADLYTQAGMLEVAAEVVERVLELDPIQPLARRFRQFIHGRLRRPTIDTLDSNPSADIASTTDNIITTLERQEPVVHELSEFPSEPSLSQLVPWADEQSSGQLSSTIVNHHLDEQPVEPMVASAALGASATEAAPLIAKRAESVIIDDDAFADVATRAAPDELLKDLAAASGAADPFAADTVIAGTPDLRTQELAGFKSTDQSLSAAASGSGRIEIGGWELETTAAVMAENHRVKPQLSLDQVEWDESDFPSYDEAGVGSDGGGGGEPVVTRTIALNGEGAVAALASLASVSPMLALFDIDECQWLLENCEVTQCFAGQEIFREGSLGTSLYLLATGQAAVERSTDEETSRRIASLSAGNFFGEGSLLADAPRSSTVRILEDSLVIELERKMVQELVVRKPRLLTVLTRFLRARLLSSLMMDSPLFHRLPPSERTALAPRIHLHKLVAEQVVAQRGQVLTGYCTLMAGTLKRFNVAEGTGTQALGKLGPGSAFGSRSLDAEPSEATISAETGCWLLRLPTEDLRELVERHPELLSVLSDAEG